MLLRTREIAGMKTLLILCQICRSNSYQSVLAKKVQSSCRDLCCFLNVCQTKNEPQKTHDLCCLQKTRVLCFSRAAVSVRFLSKEFLRGELSGLNVFLFPTLESFFGSEFWRDMGLHKLPGSPRPTKQRMAGL